jgi:hypothetical protein
MADSTFEINWSGPDFTGIFTYVYSQDSKAKEITINNTQIPTDEIKVTLAGDTAMARMIELKAAFIAKNVLDEAAWNDHVLYFKLAGEQGDKGDQGAQGEKGPDGKVNEATITTLEKHIKELQDLIVNPTNGLVATQSLGGKHADAIEQLEADCSELSGQLNKVKCVVYPGRDLQNTEWVSQICADKKIDTTSLTLLQLHRWTHARVETHKVELEKIKSDSKTLKSKKMMKSRFGSDSEETTKVKGPSIPPKLRLRESRFAEYEETTKVKGPSIPPKLRLRKSRFAESEETGESREMNVKETSSLLNINEMIALQRASFR